VAFIAMLAVRSRLPLGPEVEYPLRVLLTCAVLLVTSRGRVEFRASRAASSVALGVLVFLVWIGPEALWPGYRLHWLFRNPLTGGDGGWLSGEAHSNAAFLALRALGSALLVPVIEELFWRGWLMRWIIRSDFLNVPLGAYTPWSFWITAILFASEHGPYWEVGLITGALYNWWMLRTRRLADCILAHAVTNGCLAAYVILAGKWQYWL
jgi:hypothetical protein